MSKKGPAKKPVVVGIGASAGGLAALKAMLPNLPQGQDFAFVVLQHSDPSHPSMLAGILESLTPLRVSVIQSGEKIVSDTIYIVPAGASCELVANALRLDQFDTKATPRHLIDALLASLAESCGERCVGVILSGTGSDGLQESRAIKAEGGIVIAQDPSSADYPDMPRAVIHDALADLILAPEEIGGVLNEVMHDGPTVGPARAQDLNIESLARVLTAKVGFDFTQYKESTLKRRIERRMTIMKITSFTDYVALIRASDSEASLLLKGILISVTGFFRDKETFDAIQALIPSILNGESFGGTIRAWVPGCATGEEAFSIAMLIAEALGNRLNSIQVQIFATDVDESAIAHARRSVYLPNTLQNVPKALLEKYFTQTAGIYQVVREIRDMVVFAQQDLIQDPPFTRLDLVSCRNVLIYFKRPLQERMIATFHYILNTGGFLILGSSESLGKSDDLFEQPDQKIRVFRRKEVEQTTPALLQPHYLGRRLTFPEASSHKPQSHEHSFEKLLLEQYTPAGVLVNSRAEIVYVKGDVSRFVRVQPGKINVNVAEMAISPLRSEIRLALRKAQREKIVVRGNPIDLPDAFGDTRITVVAIPAQGNGNQMAVTGLLFEESPSRGSASGLAEEPETIFRMRELEQELAATREHLQSNIEELETANEELQSINEEYQSTTEELQFSNEEFQTTNEELQATNEELSTVNEELTSKTAELSVTNSELEMLLSLAVDGIVVLDAGMRVTRYSASSRHLFDLLPTSIGKPLIAVGGPFDLAFLSSEIQRAMASGESVDRVVELIDRSYIVRLIPITEKGEPPTGLVVTFTDQTERLAALGEAQRLAAIIKDSNDAIALLSLEGDVLAWNAGAEHQYGYTEDEALKLSIRDLVPKGAQGQALKFLTDIASLRTPESFDTQRLTKDGRVFDAWVTVTLLFDDHGKPINIATTERDISVRRRNEALQRAAELAHVHRLNTLEEMASGLAHELSQPLAAIALLSDAAIVSLRDSEAADENLVETLQSLHDQTLRAGNVIHHLREFVRKGDSERHATDFNALVKEEVRFVEPELLDKGITIDLDLAEDLPELSLDKVQIGQVLLNLLRNSIEAMNQAEGGAHHIALATRIDGGNVEISVTDSGPGLDADMLKELFQPFRTSKALGLGMGLSISRSIIEAHGGRVWADVEAKKGATFHFTLPLTVG